jgi:hypothetical protein
MRSFRVIGSEYAKQYKNSEDAWEFASHNDNEVMSLLKSHLIEREDAATEFGLGFTENTISIRERLSNLQHDIWSRWMTWMFSKGTFNSDGSWTMPVESVERWKRQMWSHYSDLPESERVSDQELADEIIKMLKTYGSRIE